MIKELENKLTEEKYEEYYYKMMDLMDISQFEPEIAHKEADELICDILSDIGLGEIASLFSSVGVPID